MTHLVAWAQTAMLLKHNRRGVTALEYGLLAALIAAVCIEAVTTLLDPINATFKQVSTVFSSGAFSPHR